MSYTLIPNFSYPGYFSASFFKRSPYKSSLIVFNTPPSPFVKLPSITAVITSPASTILSLSSLSKRSVWRSASSTLFSSFVITWALFKSVLNPSSSALLFSPCTINSVFTAVALVSCLLSCPPVITEILGTPLFVILIPPPLTLLVSLSLRLSTFTLSAFTISLFSLLSEPIIAPLLVKFLLSIVPPSLAIIEVWSPTHSFSPSALL